MDDGSCLGYDGSPFVDSKRPFGNSNVPGDVYEILDPRPHNELYDYDEEEEEQFADEQQEMYERWYPTLDKALQVVLASGSFEPGIYSCNKYSRNFELVTDENEIFKAELIIGTGDGHEDPRHKY